ncbi:MAG: L-seryl-tRNA(Sec) selenium transferase, partial [Hyphomicrobium sp.]|nr:L-seryl-tRNA(Sec) selenium transferase [Hyphomicrobium sp.]
MPSVDEVLRGEAGRVVVARFGHAATLGAVRAALDDLRALSRHSALPHASREDTAATIAARAAEVLEAEDAPRLRRVLNLTGTVLHTNLGRAVLAEEAVTAAAAAVRAPAALEFDLESGSRGELIEIGGSFRMPDIMARAGTRLREIGTTNRTHLRDYTDAIGPETAM